MKRLLLSSSIATLLLPGVAFAAYNDVSLATDVDLSVNSISLDVTGTSATVESIEVGSTNFTAVLQSGSYLKVSAPNLNQLTYDLLSINPVANSNYICTGSAATLEVSAFSTTTVIVTPSSTLCADAAEAASGSSKGDARGGGGGTVVVPVTTVVPVAQVANAEAIAAIKVQLIPLIQKLIILLGQQILTMQASGN